MHLLLTFSLITLLASLHILGPIQSRAEPMPAKRGKGLSEYQRLVRDEDRHPEKYHSESARERLYNTHWWHGWEDFRKNIRKYYKIRQNEHDLYRAENRERERLEEQGRDLSDSEDVSSDEVKGKASKPKRQSTPEPTNIQEKVERAVERAMEARGYSEKDPHREILTKKYTEYFEARAREDFAQRHREGPELKQSATRSPRTKKERAEADHLAQLRALKRVRRQRRKARSEHIRHQLVFREPDDRQGTVNTETEQRERTRHPWFITPVMHESAGSQRARQQAAIDSYEKEYRSRLPGGDIQWFPKWKRPFVYCSRCWPTGGGVRNPNDRTPFG